MIGAVRGVDPRTGRYFDDTKALLDSIDSISDDDRQAIYGGNALKVFPRLASRIANHDKQKEIAR